jgi:NAD(P)-dependent dehydrogenase (short-subunit alcohol dehydrogenase family)
MAGMMEGRSGLVTGAASGIGRACAVRFGAEGANVIVSDLESSRSAGEETVERIRSAGGTAEFVACDVSSSAECSALVDTVVSRYGRIDFAHNNAGIGIHAALAETTDEQFDRTIAVNLRGVFCGMRAQINAMLRNEGAQKGAIVNTSSNAGVRGVHLIAAYTASKHGINGLTKVAAVEYAAQGIRINCVMPGAIETPLSTDLDEARRAEILSPQPLKRFGDPAVVAAVVVWLCSADASFVNGAEVPVDVGSIAGW